VIHVFPSNFIRYNHREVLAKNGLTNYEPPHWGILRQSHVETPRVVFEDLATSDPYSGGTVFDSLLEGRLS
jgi:hypothetical protein